MTNIANKLHITEHSKGNFENRISDNEELVKTLQHLPSNPEEINRQAEEIQKQKEKESKETLTKSLEFEDHTFRISSEGFKEVTAESVKNNPNLQKFLDKGIKVKANTTWDVVEYMEDTMDKNGEIKCKKWEQIFIAYEAFIREVKKDKNCSQEEVEKKYLMTVDELKEKMKDKQSGSKEYKEFFNKEINGNLAGYWDLYNKRFCSIGARSDVWLVGGYNVTFTQDGWHWDDDTSYFGFSGRLLKN